MAATFKDRIAVVTGAGSGIGAAIARELASQSAIVCLVGRRPQPLIDVAAEIGNASRVYPVDLNLDGDVEELTNALQKDFGAVDILVHSAGVFARGPLESAPVNELDRQYRINLRAPYLLTQKLLPLLKARRGQIVFINSAAGRVAKPEVGQYAATKHALKAIADSLRAEVNAAGVRVLSIYPGRTATPMQAVVREMEGEEYRPDDFMPPEAVASMVTAALAEPASAEVTDIELHSARPL